jgi:tetratricopeptide (TPR) repeat protein
MSRAPKPLNPYASWSSLFGATVRRLRLGMRSGRPLTQEELGRQIGYSDAAVGAVERAELRPDPAFMEGCERVLPADGMLRAMFPFVMDEWATWERTGQRPLVDPPPPAELLPDPVHVAGPQGLVVVQKADAVDVLELARQAEASDLGAGMLEMIDRTVDRFCRDYPTAAPALLIPRVQQRLRYLAKLLRGKVTLAQHRHLLVASGWLTTLLACLQFDFGDREGAEASQAAAYTFAREADHQELLAWTFELLAWWALVDGRYDQVVDYARTGLAIAPTTSAGVQLAVQQAKGWSRLGDAAGADEALRTAGTVLSRLPRPAHPEHHFVFDASKLSFYAATCYTWLGDGDRAREHAQQVISQCLAVPGEVRWPMRLAETRVDLGLVAAREGQIDEACELGRQALASKRKSGATLGRVTELDAVLTREHPDSGEVGDLHDQLEAARRALTSP